MKEPQEAIDRNLKELNEASKIARFYGFKPILPPTIEKADFDVTKGFDESGGPAEKAALLRMYFGEKFAGQSQPCMFYCEKPFPGLKEIGAKRKSASKLNSSLNIMGSSKSVCECISIQTGISILHALGYKDLEIEINSIGDKESVSEFQRKINLFNRKNIAEFPAELRQAVKKDPLAILKDKKGECQNLESECPKSIDFLSETSRVHFKEVIEFLEIMNLPYQINHRLVPDLDIGSETIFAIKSGDKVLASGFRYNRLAKKIGYKKEVPSTILNFSIDLKKPLKNVKVKPLKYDFYLIQFGPEAKLKSFLVLQELFKAGVNVCHAIAKDKLAGQMGSAENSAIPYIILIGQKEALENSVVIRNSATRAQEIVLIENLAAKAKKLV